MLDVQLSVRARRVSAAPSNLASGGETGHPAGPRPSPVPARPILTRVDDHAGADLEVASNGDPSRRRWESKPNRGRADVLSRTTERSRIARYQPGGQDLSLPIPGPADGDAKAPEGYTVKRHGDEAAPVVGRGGGCGPSDAVGRLRRTQRRQGTVETGLGDGLRLGDRHVVPRDQRLLPAEQ